MHYNEKDPPSSFSTSDYWNIHGNGKTIPSSLAHNSFAASTCLVCKTTNLLSSFLVSQSPIVLVGKDVMSHLEVISLSHQKMMVSVNYLHPLQIAIFQSTLL